MFVSYYTPEYAEEAEALRETLGAFGVRHLVLPRPSLGQWERNCGMKPAFLLEMVHQHGPVCWVDADARLRAEPTLLLSVPESVDLAVHWRKGQIPIAKRGDVVYVSDFELMSGTVYVSDSDAARLLLQRWAAKCAANPEAWDQRCLQQVVHQVEGLVVANLPAAYCHVKEYMPGAPVIEHTQASRRLRACVK